MEAFMGRRFLNGRLMQFAIALHADYQMDPLER